MKTIGGASFRESVPQISGSWEEADFLPIEYVGNEDDSALCTCHVETQLQMPEMVALRNVARLDICNGTSVAIVLRCDGKSY